MVRPSTCRPVATGKAVPHQPEDFHLFAQHLDYKTLGIGKDTRSITDRWVDENCLEFMQALSLGMR